MFMFQRTLFAESFASSAAFYVQDPTVHEEEALRTIEAALAHGVNMLDTACACALTLPPLPPPHLNPPSSSGIYQNQTPDGAIHFNEALVGRALKKFGRDKFGELDVIIGRQRCLCSTLTNDGASCRHKVHAVSHGKWRNA